MVSKWAYIEVEKLSEEQLYKRLSRGFEPILIRSSRPVKKHSSGLK